MTESLPEFIHMMNTVQQPSNHRPLDKANSLSHSKPRPHHHLLLLLNKKADTHFTVPHRVYGLLSLVAVYCVKKC